LDLDWADALVKRLDNVWWMFGESNVPNFDGALELADVDVGFDPRRPQSPDFAESYGGELDMDRLTAQHTAFYQAWRTVWR
jgi:hypothetical protein